MLPVANPLRDPASSENLAPTRSLDTGCAFGMPAPPVPRQLASRRKIVKLIGRAIPLTIGRPCLTKVTAMNRVDAAQIQDFQQDGAVALRELFREWVEPLRAAIERNIAEPSAGARIYP